MESVSKKPRTDYIMYYLKNFQLFIFFNMQNLAKTLKMLA